MSAPVRLWIDTWNKVIVGGLKFTNALRLGDIVYGDVVTYYVYLLELNNQTGGKSPKPYSLVSVADLNLRFAIGDRGTGTMTPVAEQNSWSKAADNTYLYADVSFSTAEMLAAFTGTAPYQKYLEIKWDRGGNYNTIYQQLVTIHPRAISPTTVVPSSPLTPISREEVNAGFVPLEEPEGGGFRIRRSPGGRRWRDWVDDNGVQQFTEIV
jgi:hypothetical protein